MSETPHPALQFVGPLKELAEGRMAANDWLVWWKTHADEVEAVCPRGWFLKLKPAQIESGANRAASISQKGACAILETLGQSFVPSDSYAKAWNEDFKRFCDEEKAREQVIAKRFTSGINRIKASFPKFGAFLKKQAADIDQLEEPADVSEITTLEKNIGTALPQALKKFLSCTRSLRLSGLSIGLNQIFPHPCVLTHNGLSEKTICIAEYWLEADGDQVVLSHSFQPQEDSPVYYYPHAEAPSSARVLAPSFSIWIESLPKSSLFQK